MLHSLHWLLIEQRIEYKLSLLCFKIISHQAPIYLSELLHLFTPSRQLRSSTDTRVFRIPFFEQSPVVSALSLTRLQLSGTTSLPFVRHSASVLQNRSLFKTFFFSPISLIYDSVCVCVCVCACMCGSACVHSCCMC